MSSLANRRVLVTRARGQASGLAAMLSARGAEALQVPTIALAQPDSWCALDAALITLNTFDLVLFTSANAVQAFRARAQRLRLACKAKRVAAIGPATAKAVIEAQIADALAELPAQYTGEGFLESLLPGANGQRMLLVRAAVARDVLPQGLRDAGADVTVAHAYQNVVPAESVARLAELFGGGGKLDAITFTSASTADNLLLLLEKGGLVLPAGIALASIGPITSRAMREAGMEPSVEATDSTIPGLVSALEGWFAGE